MLAVEGGGDRVHQDRERGYPPQAAHLEAVHQQEAATLRQYLNDPAWLSDAPPPRPPQRGPSEFNIVKCYAEKRDETPDPTSLVIIDETDRLKTAGLYHFAMRIRH